MNTIPPCLPPHITPAQFLAEYWQKKPLLIKQGLPQLVDMFEPQDILDLATDEEATARLITQTPKIAVERQQANGDHPWKWQVKNSPLTETDFDNLPQRWTTLVQNLEQWSPELGQLWQAFDFIPQWQRDDIMVSFAPQGGSVGSHYDDYDVFLAQGYGHRRWKLGKVCDAQTQYLADQPIRLLDDMGEIIFDEVLEAGDVLYVPPKLSHDGVAQDNCLTFSFGFRRPNVIQILDNLADTATNEENLFTPLLLDQSLQNSGELTADSVTAIKAHLIDLLNSEQGDHIITQAISETVSKRQYDLLLSEEVLSDEEVEAMLAAGSRLQIDYNSRLTYYKYHDQTKIYANGQLLTELAEDDSALLVRLADGESIGSKDLTNTSLESIMEWLENGWIWID